MKKNILTLLLACAAVQAFAIPDAAKFPFQKGINLSRLESWTTTSAGYLGQNSTYTDIKSKGFDHIRFPVYFKNYYDSSTQTLKSNISVVDDVLDKCETNHLYVFLDFHGWSSINTTNGTDRADFLKIWELVADRYKDRSDYVIFELLNEPHTTEGGNLDAAMLNELQAEVLPLIRQTNPNRLVLLAAAEWNGPWKLSDLAIPPNCGPVGVVCHTYAPMDFTHQGATWAGHSSAHVSFTSTDKTETGTKDLDNAFRWIDDFQEKTGIPVVMNEFGVYQNSQATDAEVLDWTSYVARNCESNGIAWSWWEYNSGFGAYSYGQWRARVMDGLFPAEPEGNAYADWFNAADYAKKMTISFPGYAGTSPLADFPVLVKLSADIEGFAYSDFHRSGGDDLRFTDADGNLIPHEIDTWNPNGVSTVWVKVPSLTPLTTITAHYGCALPVAVDASDVWDDDYVGVWHLGEGGLPLRESSKTSTDFTKQNGSGLQYAAAGIVGGSVDFGASGNSRMITAQDCDALDGFTHCTVEAWTYQTTHATSAILSKRYSSSKNLSYFLYDNGAKTQFNLAANDSTTGNSAQIEPTLSQWTHQAYTFASGTIKGYKDGAKVGSDKTLSFSQIGNSDGYLHLGNFNRDGAWNADTRNFPGKIDEVRISKVERSADWIQATHDTIANANFATYAMVVPEPDPPPVATDMAGYDWTNRIVSVTGAASGDTLLLTLTASDGTATTATATADENGAASFNLPTTPGRSYDYALSRNGDPVGSGSFFAGAWDSDGAWFLATPDGLGGSTEVNGSWTAPPTVTNQATFAFAGPTTFSLSPEAVAAGNGKLVRAMGAISYESLIEESESLSSVPTANCLTAITAVTNSASGTAGWKAHVDGAWKTLAGGPPPEPGIVYAVRLEGDFSLASPRIRLSVSADGVSFLPLSDPATGAEWFAPSDTARHGLAAIETDGAGEIAAFGGEISNANVATAGGTGFGSLAEALSDGGEVALLTNATWPTNAPAGTVTVNRGGYALLLPADGVSVEGNSVAVSAGITVLSGVGTLHVNFGDLSGVGIATENRTPAQIAADLQSIGDNGIPKWQSYVLGLDPGDSASLPLADISMDGGNITVAAAGIDVNSDAAATVSYQVYEIADLAHPDLVLLVGEATVPGAPVALSMGSAPSRFFRIQVTMTLP